VDTGSREENASKQKTRASVLIPSEPKRLWKAGRDYRPKISSKLRAAGRRGGRTRTRTCNQTVMSGRTKDALVDFLAVSFDLDRFRRVSFARRFWCETGAVPPEALPEALRLRGPLPYRSGRSLFHRGRPQAGSGLGLAIIPARVTGENQVEPIWDRFRKSPGSAVQHYDYL
jgi:hypothetical protein